MSGDRGAAARGHGASAASRARRPGRRSCARSRSFALYGFPESHAASFALIAYASAYLKRHHPAAFVCALLNNQPMGFYHPSTLVKDAQRHGVRFRPVDVTRSGWRCTLEDGRGAAGAALRAGPARGGGGAHRGGARARGRSPRSRTSWTAAGLQPRRAAAAGRGGRAQRLRPHAAERALAGGEGGPPARAALPRRSRARTTRGLAAAGDGRSPSALTSDLAGTGLSVGRAPGLALPPGARRARRAARGRPAAARGRGLRARGGRRDLPPAAGHGEGLHVPDARGRDRARQRDRAARPLRARARRRWCAPAFLEIDGVLQATDGLSVRAVAVRPALAGAPATPARDFH